MSELTKIQSGCTLRSENHLFQDASMTLQIKLTAIIGSVKMIKTHEWDKRLGMSIFGIICVDANNVHQSCVHPSAMDPTPYEWYLGLAEEMIDNDLDTRALRSSATPARNLQPTATIQRSPHLTPSREKKRKRDGSLTAHTLQGHCRGCGKKTTYQCSICMRDNPLPKPWFCRCRDDSYSCFRDHVSRCHHDI